MKIKLTFSYDGSKFSGFQRQNNVKSVQKEIESALSDIYGVSKEIKGAGRTDAGVHANGQVAHYETDKEIKDLKAKLNQYLMPNIVIKQVKKVDDNFHARFSVKKKEYIYKINLGPYKSALNDYVYQPTIKLDIGLMKSAAKYMIGTHDFENFVSGQKEDTTTTINSITFTKTFGILEIHFIGTGFYRYMIRNLVGALIEVGKCKISFLEIKDIVENKINRSLPTAPACGLYLNKIWY